MTQENSIDMYALKGQFTFFIHQFIIFGILQDT